jgi:hypothetical protein
MVPGASGQWPTAGLRLLPRAACLALSPPPFPSLHLAMAYQAHAENRGVWTPCVWAGIMGEASRLGNAESERMAWRTARSKSGNGEWPVRALALPFLEHVFQICPWIN